MNKLAAWFLNTFFRLGTDNGQNDHFGETLGDFRSLSFSISDVESVESPQVTQSTGTESTSLYL